MNLTELNALDAPAAGRDFLRCCGSRRWAEAMAAARPFASADAMASTADAIWSSLDRADWLEAFAAHPRIGSATDVAWSAAEQSGMSSATSDVRERLIEAQREYEARFGYIFIVCATGRRADEMLQMLQERLDNDPHIELRIAAEEQRKITRLRLDKLIESKGTITTHVLDTSRGRPADGLHVVLEVRDGEAWVAVGSGVTDANGRLATMEGRALVGGTYRLTFQTAAYHRAQGIADPFYPDVVVTFVVGDPDAHYHVPLLLSPFGYSTYRGS
jgi:5-hydroxyisourate hydrolase / 2-oxo-4-hydroxy-4-carboxy-5-ureidoimidazoline decarboxylase